MNVINKTSLMLALSCVAYLAGISQTSFNLYPVNAVIGIRFFNDKKVSVEPRLDFQFDRSNGENNVFVNSEVFTLFNIKYDEKLKLYSGFGLGANLYNQAQSNFTGAVPIGATYYIDEKKRIGIIGEFGVKATAFDFLKIKSYVLVGILIKLKKEE